MLFWNSELSHKVYNLPKIHVWISELVLQSIYIYKGIVTLMLKEGLCFDDRAHCLHGDRSICIPQQIYIVLGKNCSQMMLKKLEQL